MFLRVEPLQRGSGFEFVDHVKGGVIPYNLIPAVEKGVREVLRRLRRRLPDPGHARHGVDGKHHPVDSKEVAFIAAGRKAMLDALGKARPIVLEPIVAMEVAIPDAHMGDITGDLSSRRGHMTGTGNLAGGMMACRRRCRCPSSTATPTSSSRSLPAAAATRWSCRTTTRCRRRCRTQLANDFKARHKQAEEED